MSTEVKPYKDSDLSKKNQVTQMFDTIAGEYDQLNRVISMGIDLKWRRKVIDLVREQKPTRVLDVATGTGDLAVALVDTGAKKVVGLDLSPGMLALGIEKVAKHRLSDQVDMVLGDSEALPFDTDSFDAATVAFGVRNFEHLNSGLGEIFRVIKPGGLLVVLETSVPERFPAKQGYQLYSNYLLPLIGRLFSKDRSAYRYLSESAAKFPCGKKFNALLKEVGFERVNDLPQTLGVATIYTAYKPI
jgi:demethylmenaquinone methyltransferase/2-methoxy-6-polyprenyl-1,4-benzoquinol methylase